MRSRRSCIALAGAMLLLVAACSQQDDESSDSDEVEVLGLTLDSDDPEATRPPFSPSETDSDVRRPRSEDGSSPASEDTGADPAASSAEGDRTDGSASEGPASAAPADGQPDDEPPAQEGPGDETAQDEADQAVSLADGYELHESRRQPDDSDDGSGWTATSSLALDPERPTIHGRARDLDDEQLSCTAVVYAPAERRLIAEATLRTLIEHVANDGTVTTLAERTEEVATELDAGTTLELDAVGPVDLDPSDTAEVICRVEVDI